MLSEARAARLARRAGLWRAGAMRRFVADRAWRRLTGAVDDGDRNAIGALLQAWPGHRGDELWAVLSRWRTPRELAWAAFAAAADPGRSDGERAAIGTSCARRGLVPGDPVRRALFYVLTGQADQHRAADPDGSLIAVAYQGADQGVRAALRAALAGSGSLDLVRVVAGQRGPVAPLTAAERAYLTRQLAGRADWAGLWRLVMELPLTEAVAAMRLFDARWRPSADRERALFGRLAAADPDQIAEGREALPGAEAIRVAIPDDAAAVRGAISADGRRLAVVTAGWAAGARPWRGKRRSLYALLEHSRTPALGTVSVFDLPDGTLAERYNRDDPAHDVLAFAGDALIVASREGSTLHRLADGRAEQFAALDYAAHGDRVLDLAPSVAHAGGLAVLCPGGLLFCDPGGLLAEAVPLPDELNLRERFPNPGWPLLGLEPGGRVAVAGPGGFAVLDARDPRQARLLACERPKVFAHAGVTGVRFCGAGADRVVTIVTSANLGSTVRDLVQLWRPDGSRAELLAQDMRMYPASTPAAIPERGQVAVTGGEAGIADFLDDAKLRRSRPPEGFSREGVTALWNSADGRGWVSGGWGFALVMGMHGAAEVAGRPPGRWTPADRATVAGALRRTAAGSATWPLLDLLREWLDHRFGADVAIGRNAPAIGDDGIGISRDIGGRG